jgi:hypothetical protein
LFQIAALVNGHQFSWGQKSRLGANGQNALGRLCCGYQIITIPVVVMFVVRCHISV